MSFITSLYTQVFIFHLPPEQSISYTAGGMDWLNTELCMVEPAKEVEELKNYLKKKYWEQFVQMKYFEVSWYVFACKFLP